MFCVTFMMILVFLPQAFAEMDHGKRSEDHWVCPDSEAKKSKAWRKLEASMDQYHATAAFWVNHKRIILNVFIITFVQRVYSVYGHLLGVPRFGTP